MNEITSSIIAFQQERLPALLTRKYHAMSENPFRFFRAINRIFYRDLVSANLLPASPLGWISGDLHLENFGTYKSENRLVYFDLNDFDDSLLAPVLWEAVRMATSIVVAFESLKIDRQKAIKMVQLFVKAYADTLAAGKPDYIEPRTARGIVADFLTSVGKRSQKELLEKRTVRTGNDLNLVIDNKRHVHLPKPLKQELIVHATTWLKHDSSSPYNFKVIDAAFRVAGTSSLGLKRFVILLKSLYKEKEKYLLLDMKQAAASAVMPFIAVEQPAWQHEAERIVSIQRIMQNRAPALLSTTVFKGEEYVVQEMQPIKDSINFKLIKNNYRNIYQVIDSMGMLTASSQLRATGRLGSAITDELMAFATTGEWRDAVLNYALQYASQVKTYYRQFIGDLRKMPDNKVQDPIRL